MAHSPMAQFFKQKVARVIWRDFHDAIIGNDGSVMNVQGKHLRIKVQVLYVERRMDDEIGERAYAGLYLHARQITHDGTEYAGHRTELGDVLVELTGLRGLDDFWFALCENVEELWALKPRMTGSG